MRSHLPSSLPDQRQLKRYVIAYDGDIVPEFDQSAATHLVVGGAGGASSESEASVPTVTPDWLWSCIQEKTLVPLDA
jgi:DNA ligase-3